MSLSNVSFFSRPVNALFGGLAFVFVGWFAWQQPGLFPKIIGTLVMLFFGVGSVVIAWRLLRAEYGKAGAKIRYADHLDDVIVQRIAMDDKEVEECWRRAGHHFQNVSATRSCDEEFCWSVDLASGEFFRQGQNSEYSEAIHDAISGVTGVREVVREDHEHWAVDGDCDGEELVKMVAFANDQFVRKYYE